MNGLLLSDTELHAGWGERSRAMAAAYPAKGAVQADGPLDSWSRRLAR